MPLRELFGGACLTLFQLLVALAIAPRGPVPVSYTRLCMWDCAWYQSIVVDGYHTVIPPVRQRKEVSNVAFFPAYPYAARLLHVITGLRSDLSLLVISQLFCVVFWTILLKLLKRWKIGFTLSVVVAAAIMAHPAAFFLIAGYSESMFLASLLAYILMSNRSGTASLWGALMSGSRIVGIPAAVYPFLKGISIRSLSVAVVASLGGLGFFAYCWLNFGQYDLYMQTQRIGWGIVPDYSALLELKHFVYTTVPDRYATLLSFVAFAGVAILELVNGLTLKIKGLGRRLPVYVIAFVIFFLTISGLKTVSFRSMVRYTLPWHILIVLCLADFVRRCRWTGNPWFYSAICVAVSALAMAFVKLEIPFFRDFLCGRWFA
jgi:hypothetical protein